ncbi:MAG: exo-alpha-sialidase [SAR202 cluster bacterium]|nr:exo-alpha-sialidase [SAR202 cluster bacterium]
MFRTPLKLSGLRHTKVCYSKENCCGHPRQSGIFYYGNGEIAALHSHATSAYANKYDVSHSFNKGYAGRAHILLQRSMDFGETWPAENNVVVWDEGRSLEEKRAIVGQADGKAPRERIDLAGPDSAVYFTRTATGPLGPDGGHELECFAFRSGDRGRTWEKVPTRVRLDRIPRLDATGGAVTIHRDGHPLVKCPDGSLLGVMSIYGSGSFPPGVALYGSDDNGLSWEYLAKVAEDSSGMGRPTYPGLVLLPSGRLQCYMLQIGGVRHAIQMNYSDDGGYSWSVPKPIVAWGSSVWNAPSSTTAGARGVYYRSPWPKRLRDGRIAVIFGRRKPPCGIGVIVSEDEGETWSGEAIVRDDSAGADVGYPIAVQFEDERIFTAYYITANDGNGMGGTRYIAGSLFTL